MTFEKPNKFLSFLFFITLFISCSAKYVEIETPSNKIEVDCFSIIPPAEGKWYKLSISHPGCEDKIKLVSGNETDIYWILFIADISSWSDKYDDEYLLKKTEKSFESERNSLLKDKNLGIEVINYELKIVKGVKDILVELKYELLSGKPLAYSMGGWGYPSPTTNFGENGLNPSDNYFYENVEFHVIEGPYKAWIGIGREAIIYKVVFMHVSVNENRDPKLEEKALKFLENVESTLNWEKDIK